MMAKNKSQRLSTNVSTTYAGQLSKAQGNFLKSVHSNRKAIKKGLIAEADNYLIKIPPSNVYIKETRKERKSINYARPMEDSN